MIKIISNEHKKREELIAELQKQIEELRKQFEKEIQNQKLCKNLFGLSEPVGSIYHNGAIHLCSLQMGRSNSYP